VQETVLAGKIDRFTACTVTDPDRLRHMLADVRTNGFSVSDRQITMDALSVGAPVMDGRGRVVAAVSLVVHHDAAPAHTLAPLVRTSARAISRVLGQPPPPG
jgi:DNA-binding IclR family transcriptional regulator